MIKGIILAAGRGSRLGHLTKKKPKSFNKTNNKRYIDIVIDNFKENNINDINIVVGYKKNLFKKFPQKKILNNKWKSTNIFYSLSQKDISNKWEALKFYETETKKFPYPRSKKGIESLASYRGMQSGNEYAEAFKLIKGIIWKYYVALIEIGLKKYIII